MTADTEAHTGSMSARSERQRAPQSRAKADSVSARSERQRAPQSRAKADSEARAPEPEGADPGSGPPAGLPGLPKAWAVLALVAFGALALDLFTKQLALTQLEGRPPVRLLGGALYLTLTRNSGAAFSIGGRYTMIFPVIALVVVVGIAWLAWRLRSIPWAVAMGLILGGALGNLVDRVFRAPGPMRGHVVDFLSLFDEAGRVWPIFNAADSALFCGVVLAVILEFTGRHRDGSRAAGGDGATLGS